MSLNNAVQRAYSEIVIRGRRNAPTYAEVKRDVTDLTSRIDPVVGLRY